MPKMLDECGLDYRIVVEPQFAEKYLHCYGADELLILPKSNMGLPYARNHIKAHSIATGAKYHWQLDDNVSAFLQRVNGYNLDSNAIDNITHIESVVRDYSNIGIAGMGHVCFAWTAKGAQNINKQIHTCFLVNNSTPCVWRDDCPEDTDYSMQVLSLGLCTILFSHCVFNKPASGSMSGGAKEVCYSNDGPKKRCDGLMKLWPGCFQSAERNGRMRIKPSRVWSTFKQRPISVTEKEFFS